MREPEIEFSSLVRRVRLHLNLSQEDLARELGVSFSTVNRWENGKTQPIKLARQQFEHFCARMIRQKRISPEILSQP